MIELLVAFVLGAITGVPVLVLHLKAESRHDTERLALLDRVQSPDLAAYYGARAAYYPAEFPTGPEITYQHDDFGFTSSEPEPGNLPGELPPEGA